MQTLRASEGLVKLVLRTEAFASSESFRDDAPAFSIADRLHCLIGKTLQNNTMFEASELEPLGWVMQHFFQVLISFAADMNECR